MDGQTSPDLPTYTDSPRLPQGVSPDSVDGRTAGVASALARFEYEAEKTSVADATKVLLIEWEEERESTVARDNRTGQWSIQWKGKNNTSEGITLKSTAPPPIPDYSKPSSRRTNSLSDPASHRLYFLLPPGAPVPPSVGISFTPLSAPSPTIATSIPTLPAIFPPSLLTSGTSLGKKGVLHTLWAKSRLAALRAEIDEEEEQGRLEGVGIDMAQSELDWIKEHFGVSEKLHSSSSTLEHAPQSPNLSSEGFTDDTNRGRNTAPKPSSPVQLSPPLPSATTIPSPTSATSPSDRLQQKMKGLRVGTTPAPSGSPTPPSSASSATAKGYAQPQVHPGVFTPPQTNSSNNAERNPLSPEVGDVAIGSRSLFAALKGPHPNETKAQATSTSQPKRPVAVAPPSGNSFGGMGFRGMGSLDGIAGGKSTSPLKDDEPEEGLFALPISPRSPEMAVSPFSFEGKGTAKAGGS